MTRSGPLLSSRSAQAGLTLVEMMVVLAVVAVIAGASLGILGHATGQRLEQQAETFAARLSLAADEALVTGSPIALVASADSYHFAIVSNGGALTAIATGPLAEEMPASVSLVSPDGASTSEFVIPPDATASSHLFRLQRGTAQIEVLFNGLEARIVLSDEVNNGA